MVYAKLVGLYPGYSFSTRSKFIIYVDGEIDLELLLLFFISDVNRYYVLIVSIINTDISLDLFQ